MTVLDLLALARDLSVSAISKANKAQAIMEETINEKRRR
jgi:hypothetical protein